MEKTNNSAQAFWVGLGSLSAFAVSIVGSAVLSRYFEKEEYGTYRQILYVYNTLLIVFTAGLPRVYGYYLPRYDVAKGKSIVQKVTFLLFILGLIFSLTLYSFSGLIAEVLKNEALKEGLEIFSPIPLLLLPTLGIESIFSTYQKSFYAAIYNVLTRILMLLFIVLPVIFWENSYKTALYGWIAASLFTLIIGLIFMNIPYRKVDQRKSDLTSQEILKYSVPIMAAGVSGIAIKAADQFFISRYFGEEVFAEYANGFIQLPFVTMITGAASVVVMPLFSKLTTSPYQTDEILRLWKNTLEKSAILIYPIVIFFMLNATPTVVALFSEKYIASSKYFQINMVLNFFNIIIFAPLLLSLGESKFYFKIHFYMAFWAWISYCALVHLTDNPIWIAVLSVANSVLLVLLCVFKTTKLLTTNIAAMFPLRKMFKIILHGLIIGLVIKFGIDTFFKLNEFWYLIVSGSVYAVLLILSSKFLNVDYFESLKPVLKKIIKK